MTSIQPQDTQAIQYPSRTIIRAERAMRCSPLQLPLFMVMRSSSVSLNAIASDIGVNNGYTQRPLPELVTENAMLWLIQVGILRREVDGQGITDSFRLTPLGRQLVEKWQQQGGILLAPSFLDHLYNALSRWFRLPF